jgi:hypothetical protein
VSCPCRPLVAAAIVALAVAAAPRISAAQQQVPDFGFGFGNGTTLAQVLDPNLDLLQPNLEGNPKTPPRFRRPGQPGTAQTPPADSLTAPSRIGATPVYGSPPAFGAGGTSGTGYDSSNTPKSKKRAATPPPLPGVPTPETTFDSVTPDDGTPAATPAKPAPAPPVPEIYPKKAANRAGAVLPPPDQPLPVSNPPPEVHPLSAANRAGANLPPLPPTLEAESTVTNPPPGTPPLNSLPLGTVPQRTLPTAEGDPYGPVGIRAGSLILFPAVDLSAGYDTNPAHTPGGAASPYFVIAPELQVQSDWSQHSLTANITSSYTDYTSGNFQPTLNRPYLNSIIDGRIDVSRNSQIVLENRVLVTTDNPGSPNLTAGLASLPIDTTVGGTLGWVQTFNRLSVALRGTVDNASYQESRLTDGSTASNVDRDFNQYGLIGRIGYELNPGFKPFLQVQEDTRIYQEEFDRFDERRNSTGTTAELGATLDLAATLTGEMAAGYAIRDYIAPLPNVGGFVANGSLLWQATALTSAKLSASSVINESIAPGVSGAFSRDLTLQVDHALRRWLIATVKAGYGRDDYVGIDRLDNRFFASIGFTYKFNRMMALHGELRQDWLTSNVTGVAYDATSVLVGVRLQR